MIKKQRQDIIIEIVSCEDITTQEILKSKLEEKGINVTQATLSRDINELKLKKESNGIYRYIQPIKMDMVCPQILKDSVKDIVFAMNTVVLKCHTGMAQAACATIDKMDCTDIVGTLAGDDTVFILMPDKEEAEIFCKTLRNMILK